MGDTRISVSLILGGIKKSNVTFLPADSPLCEVAHQIKTSVLSDINDYSFNSEVKKESSNGRISLAIYDCTLNPPKDVTSVVNRYHSSTGPNSITLQTLNWFPSAKLVIFDREDDQARMSVLNSSINTDEDFQYNLPSSNSSTSTKIKGVRLASEVLNSGSEKKLLPSEVLQAVESRFEGLENITNSSHDVSKVMSKPTKKRTEEERQAQIDARLKRLDQNSKHSKVSAQVKKMLIKSRAEGDKKIRVEDRFYLETVVIDDSNGSIDSALEEESTHCFYGRSNNVGKIVSSALRNFNLGSDQMAELLVIGRNGGGRACSYKRLPNTMPIYDAECYGQLNSFDRVVVRVYNRLEETSNPTFVEGNDNIPSQKDDAMSLDGAKDDESTIHQSGEINNVDISSEGTNAVQTSLCMSISHAIEELENTAKKLKKKTAATEKVKQILLKGKAKGNKKIRDVDRIYLEVVYLNKQFKPTIYPVFLSVYDPIKELSKYINENFSCFTLLVEGKSEGSRNEKTYNVIPTERRCVDLKTEGLLVSFKRIIFLIE